LLEAFRQSENLAWSDPWLEAQDLEYHQIDPERSLGLAVADLSGPWGNNLDDPAALTTAPAGTRAARRGGLMRRLAESGKAAVVDWNYVAEEGRDPLPMLDPYRSS
jgi:proteasome accessory factor A